MARLMNIASPGAPSAATGFDTPIALLTMRWIDRPHVLHGDVATTISVVSGAKMPNDDGEIQ